MSSRVGAEVPPLRSLVPRALRCGMTAGGAREGKKGDGWSYEAAVGGARPTNSCLIAPTTLSDSAAVIP
ncbi:MAG: hypothetical protein LBH84_09355 [Prevotellaceae bacterium]|nr:hypothetical protein [Prevotellaceae bacterium]